MTDAQLARRSQGGDRDAFTVLAGRWQGRLQAFLRNHLGSEEDARDLCQEALLKAFVNIRRLRRPEHFKTWIHSIALNLSRDRGRREVHRAQHESDIAPVEMEAVVDRGLSPLDEAERRKLAAVLRRALAALPDEQRSAILLREVGDFNSSEIAVMTGVPAATVRSRIYYGLRALRLHLEEEGLAAPTPDRSES